MSGDNRASSATRMAGRHWSQGQWDMPPTVFYRHIVKAKSAATVLLAGDHGEPLLVGTTCGKGRVVVFTGTVLGQPSEGQAAFWNTQAWKAVLSRAVTWAAGR